MTDIPGNVVKAAYMAYLTDIQWSATDEDYVDGIARAIMEERQRCAVIARLVVSASSRHTLSSVAVDAEEAILAGIEMATPDEVWA